MRNLRISLILTLFLLFSLKSFSQNDNAPLRNDAVKIFLDCGDCDEEYIKREISFVNYVRDSKEAQVHVMMTDQNAANGGDKYNLLFLGQKDFTNQNDTLSFVSQADNTDDEIRSRQVKYIKLGLIKYVSHTELADLIDIKFKNNKGTKQDIVKDKWNSWVFRINSSSWLRGESSYSNFYLWSSINAERITPEWKVQIKASNNYSKSVYEISEDEDYTTINESYSLKEVVVKSVNEHWSVGVTSKIGSATYNNFDFYGNIFPAIEYNVFPYSKSSIKQLTARFETGYEYDNYIDSTIYDKTSEHLFKSQLSVAYIINKKWGNINTSVSGLTLMSDLSKYNVDLDVDLNVRIVKGLSFRVSGGTSLIRNQINLKKGGATYEEKLLRQQQISTDYNFWMSAGLSFTFGSIYNNVVNPRFDN